MLLKKITLLVSLLFIRTLLAGDFSSESQKINSTINVITQKANQVLRAESEDCYEDLENAVASYFINHDKSLLKKLTLRPSIVQMILQLLKKLTHYQLHDNNKTIRIKYKRLGLFEYNLFQFINYLLFISKITDSALMTHSIKEPISLFSDQVFSNPLLIFLLVSSLNAVGYKSTTLTIVASKETDYQKLNTLISELYNVEFTINQYQSASTLIKTDNKIDICLSNLSIPTEQHYFRCVRKKQISTKQVNFYQLFITYSKATETVMLVSSKLQTQSSIHSRDNVFKKLIQELRYPTEEITQETINKYSCILRPSPEITLADLIYFTHRKQEGMPIPLFVYYYNTRDTGAGIVAQNTIVETLLSNVTNHQAIICSLFKTNIGLVKSDIDEHAAKLQAFSYNRETDTVSIYKETLNDAESTISTFLRSSKTLAPTIIDIP